MVGHDNMLTCLPSVSVHIVARLDLEVIMSVLVAKRGQQENDVESMYTSVIFSCFRANWMR